MTIGDGYDYIRLKKMEMMVVVKQWFSRRSAFDWLLNVIKNLTGPRVMNERG